MGWCRSTTRRPAAEIIRLVGHAAVVRSIAFAPDGRGLATGGADRTIKLWDVPASESLSLVREAVEGNPRESAMTHHHRFGIATVGLVLGGLCALAGGGRRAPATGRSRAAGRPARVRSAGEAPALARQIDRLLAAKWAEAKVRPAPPADDAESLRRVYLDLVGKIPTAAEARDFLDDPSPDKCGRLVEVLLDSPAYLTHATETYRAMLLPEAETDGQVRALAPTFEAWLRKKIAEDAGYDQIVREVLTVRLGGQGRRGGNAYDPRAEPSPLAYYFAKDAKPENLAAGTARTFLGVRLECAQCHNHPFDQWKREEFWGLAAFFAGVPKRARTRLRPDPRGRRPPRGGDPRTRARSSRRRSSTPRSRNGRSPGDRARAAGRLGDGRPRIPTSPARRSIASGPGSSAPGSSTRSTTSAPTTRRPTPSCSTCWPINSGRTATT